MRAKEDDRPEIRVISSIDGFFLDRSADFPGIL
jgi:hypothetical protein